MRHRGNDAGGDLLAGRGGSGDRHGTCSLASASASGVARVGIAPAAYAARVVTSLTRGPRALAVAGALQTHAEAASSGTGTGTRRGSALRRVGHCDSQEG